jgi:sec-independent protein translocase protein TatC
MSTNETSAGEKRLTLLGHLLELRNRLTYCAIALVVTIGVSFIFANQLFEILTRPAGAQQFVFIEITEMMSVYMKVCLAAGLVLAMPYIIYHIVMYISPGLTQKEKRMVNLIIPWVGLMFIVGVVFGYLVLLPPALKFLFNFGTNIATPQIRIENYISVVTRLLLVIGLVFELPVLIAFLARIGVVNAKWLSRQRKWAYVLAFVLSALITPTMDPVNQTIVAVPLIALYEISILLAWLVQKKKVEADTTKPPD